MGSYKVFCMLLLLLPLLVFPHEAHGGQMGIRKLKETNHVGREVTVEAFPKFSPRFIPPFLRKPPPHFPTLPPRRQAPNLCVKKACRPPPPPKSFGTGQ